jgi:hypothetical protein
LGAILFVPAAPAPHRRRNINAAISPKSNEPNEPLHRAACNLVVTLNSAMGWRVANLLKELATLQQAA